VSDRPTREQALDLLKEFNKTESLIKHALAVEATLRYFARKRGEDEEMWGVVGLIHDLDYEQYPEQHCTKTREILESRGWPPDYVRAVMSHAWGMFTEIKPETELEKVLYTIDELTGLVVTTALVRPSKSLMDLTPKSVKKKWKDKRFAAGVNREVIEAGAGMLGLELTEIIQDTIMGMREIAPELGLSGEG
jgi:putative nucleotidyltransferase with HDIG domain